MSDELDRIREQRIQRARLGLDMEQAKASPLYHYLLSVAEVEAERANEALVNSTTANIEEIMRLRNEVRRHRDFIAWVDRAIEDGHEAVREDAEDAGAD